MILHIIFSALFLLSFSDENPASPVRNDNNQAKEYWYAGDAEISSYTLNQSRYGEIHEGQAVLVFVTEHFSKKTWTKAENPGKKDVSVLKLNFTKNFNTGIYPYSMMNSTFFPFKNGKHSLKISSSSQEWCGHTYMELKSQKNFKIQVSSYFENENIEISLNKDFLEDDFWSMIRLAPDKLPIGKAMVIPSFFYLRLAHKETKAYTCNLSTSRLDKNVSAYTIQYPELERSLTIQYESTFPYKILSWEESYGGGLGPDRKVLTTTGKLNKTLKTDYWNKHANKDRELRVQLGLD